MKKFQIFKRIRKPSPNPAKFLRLNRAEFGSTYKKKNYDYENYYPDITPLIKAVSKFFNISKNLIYLGGGGESIIKDIFLLMFLKSKRTLLFNPSNFFMYQYYSDLFNFKKYEFLNYPNDVNYFDQKFIKSNLQNKKIDFLILVNPSHPFENFLGKNKLKYILDICKKRKIFVLLDEVYLTNNKLSSLSFIKKYKNLIILKSLSKIPGSPSLRVAFAFAQEKIINEINTVRLAIELPEYNIRKACMQLNRPKKYIYPKIEQIINARSYAHNEFRKRNIKSYGKFGNSVTALLDSKDQTLEVGKYLEKKNILINYRYSYPFDKYINLTTTNKNNLKYFFKLLDKIKFK